MERIRELVNEYLVSLEFCILYAEETDAIIQMLAHGRKVDAIKYLRGHTEYATPARFVLRDGSTFAAWLKDNGKTEYEKMRRLRLKEAKDIVDFIEDNMA